MPGRMANLDLSCLHMFSFPPSLPWPPHHEVPMALSRPAPQLTLAQGASTTTGVALTQGFLEYTEVGGGGIC